MILEFALFSQRLFGKRIKGIANRMKELKVVLGRAGLMLPVEAYVSMMLLMTLIIFFAAGLNIFVLVYALTGHLSGSLLAGLGGGTAVGGFTLGILYMYPSIVAGKRRRAVEQGLSFTLSFMSILSSAGVPPKRIFKTIALLEQERGVGLGGEGQIIYRDMELLGEDMLSVLKDAATRKISSLFSGVLEGIISTIKSGGVLTKYLEEEARSLMRMRRSIMKEFIDTLVMISEIYMSVLVAFPLIMIVMLVVMSSIGGGDISGTSPGTIVPMIIYVLVPGAGLSLLFMLDSISPK